MNSGDGKIKTGMLGALNVKETMHAVLAYIHESLSMH